MNSARTRTDIGSPRPVADGERLLALDVLRGFALLGVFVVNFVYSSGPDAYTLRTGVGPANTIGWVLVHALFETKFVTIFSLLFGMGLVLQTSRQEQRGMAVGSIYLRRQALLCLLGLLHGFLLFEGDILFLYSLVGVALFSQRHRSPRTLLRIGLVPLAIGIALSVGLAALPGNPEPTAGDAIYNSLLVRSVTEGPLSLTLLVRGFNFVVLEILFTITSFNWRVLGLFFLGAAAMKAGWIHPGRRPLQKRIALYAVPAGLLLEAASLALLMPTGAESPLGTLLHEIGSLTLGAGFASTVTWCVHAGHFPRVARHLAAVGRMALTNYLVESVLLNVVLYWFGFGLWGRIDHLSAIALVAALYGLQVVISSLWLRAFTFGPAEWLWRSLTYGRRQPLRHRQPLGEVLSVPGREQSPCSGSSKRD